MDKVEGKCLLRNENVTSVKSEPSVLEALRDQMMFKTKQEDVKLTSADQVEKERLEKRLGKLTNKAEEGTRPYLCLTAACLAQLDDFDEARNALPSSYFQPGGDYLKHHPDFLTLNFERADTYADLLFESLTDDHEVCGTRVENIPRVQSRWISIFVQRRSERRWKSLNLKHRM